MNRLLRFDSLRDERGLALVSVLWALSILSLIAAAMMSSGVISYRMERNDWQRLQAQMLADSAINRGILALNDSRAEMRWRVDGVSQDFSFKGMRVRVWVQTELGKVDLNAADRDLLKGLFRSMGLTGDQADMFTDRVIDWRTAGDEKLLNGANQADYRSAGFAYQPRNGPFQSVDELKLVMGMTPQLFARIEPALTVYSKLNGVEEQSAPREALLALPGMDEQKADAIIAARINSTGSLSVQASGSPAGMIDPASLNGRTFTITAEVESATRRLTQQAVVLLTGNPAQPYLILAWR